jgi:squalene-hopene/tetraprenyl-beta-curcumene cyclase
MTEIHAHFDVPARAEAGAEPDAAAPLEAPAERLDASIAAAWAYFERAQNSDGHWVAELEGDTILESEYAMMLYFMDRKVSDKIHLLAEHIRRKQMPEGGWNMYPGGAPDISGSVKSYLTLKLAGDDPEAPHMQRAREVILGLGGVTAANTFTKFSLAMLGEYDWSCTPAIPPEIILLPPTAYFNIYAISSWSRAMVITMAIIWHHKPVVRLPKHAHIDELFVGGKDIRRMGLPFAKQTVSWRNAFLLIDKALKALEALRVRPLRAEALKRCEAWMVEHFDKSGGVGAIFPPMVNSVLAMRCLGYRDDHPQQRWAREHVESLEILDGTTMRLQPCFSPVWDTVLTVVSARGADVPADHPALQRAARWVLEHEVKQAGDIQAYRPSVPVAGWYFEYANEFYPDVDDTIVALMALDGVRLPDGEDGLRRAALHRGLSWVLSMQSQAGGWAAFDVDNDRKILEQVPFADHNAMLDPPTADISARVLECLARFGHHASEPRLRPCVEFLKREQEHDGCWYGRWGTNYIYGTWQVLRGAEAIGLDMKEPWLVRGADWLRRHQNADGGWGESCNSYENPALRGQGPSTASQTAWALMGLMSAGDYTSAAVRAGIAYLLDTQTEQGRWHDDYFTGTGFPKVFYLKYHYYSAYFPMYALGMYRRGLRRLQAAGATA